MNIRIGCDLDGTILDSRFRHQKVLHECLTKFGNRLLLDDLNDFVKYKRSGLNTVAYLEHKGFAHASDVFALWKTLIEDDRYLDLDRLFPGVFMALQSSHDKADFFLVTARNNKQGVIRQLNILNIVLCFKDVFIVDPGERSDMRKIDATKSLYLSHVIGDTEVDWNWARFLNAAFFPLNCGFRNKAWWRDKEMQSYRSFSSALHEIFKHTGGPHESFKVQDY